MLGYFLLNHKGLHNWASQINTVQIIHLKKFNNNSSYKEDMNYTKINPSLIEYMLCLLQLEIKRQETSDNKGKLWHSDKNLFEKRTFHSDISQC